MQHGHRLAVRGHDVVFADDLEHTCTKRQGYPPRPRLVGSRDAAVHGVGAFTQQSAKWSCSSANRRPTHILFPTPKGRCAKGLIFFS